tara:strand:+ start:245 stop:481 length:237 start_codon:yes stop_codon:yes gene_type:complete
VPVYTFKCNECNSKIELLQKFEDNDPECNICNKGVAMKRLVSITGKPKFCGTGFYETDYKKNKKEPLKKNGSKDKKND